MNKSKYLIKNIGILTISNFSSKILVFLLVPLYTSVLTTAEYGSYDLAVSTATLLYPILTLNIVDGVMRFSMDKNYSKKSIASIGITYIGISCFLFGIGIILLEQFNISSQIKGLEILIFLYYVSYVFYQYMVQFAKGLEYVKYMGIAGVISTVVTLSTNILFLLVFRWGLNGFFLANILAQVLSSVYLAIKIKLWKYIQYSSMNKELNKEMLIYCVPLIATILGWWVNSTSDRYVVTFICGIAANGLLSVSYKIPQIINTLQGIFIQAWQISAIKEYGEQDTAKFYGKTFSWINMLMCAACSWLIILTRPLASILYANDFYQAWQYVPFLLIASVWNSASGMLGPILAAKKDSKAMMWSAVIGALANIIMNIGLVYLIGIQGATIATAICSFIIYAIRKKAIGQEIEIKHYGVILLTWMILCVQAITEIYLKSYLTESVIMLVLLIINFDIFKEIAKIINKTFYNIKDRRKTSL